MSAERTQGSGTGLLMALLAIPFFIISVLVSVLGWFVALAGGRYRLIKLLTLPAWFISSNFFGGLVFVCLGWLYALVTDNREMARYVFGSIGDLAIFPVWGRIINGFYNFGMTNFDITIPLWHVIVYQLVLYLLVGHRLARQWTCAVVDSAICYSARARSIQPITARQERYQSDAGYKKAVDFYQKGGKPPLMAVISVALSGANPAAFY